jgi:TIR domain
MKIFVSYRRTDSAGWTGRLVDALARRFGRNNVFLDLHAVEPGDDFIAKITQTLQKVDYTLVIVGPAWLTVADQAGNRRLDAADDIVRLEISLALQSASRVIPVLVGGATMPTQATLPDGIKALATRNAVEVTDRGWSQDAHQLVAGLAGKFWWRRLSLTAVAFIEIIFIALWIYQQNLEVGIRQNEAKSTMIRNNYIYKMQVGSDECMAGIWPEGAVKGKTYRENGNMVTDECKGVSVELGYFQQFFNDEQLWRLPPSSESATGFVNAYARVFERNIGAVLATQFTAPLNAVTLALADKGKQEVAGQAREVVALKQNTAQLAERLAAVQNFTLAGLYWTIIIGLSMMVWFARGAVNFRRWQRAS